MLACRSLRASQSLNADFSASADLGRDLLEKLNVVLFLARNLSPTELEQIRQRPSAIPDVNTFGIPCTRGLRLSRNVKTLSAHIQPANGL